MFYEDGIEIFEKVDESQNSLMKVNDIVHTVVFC